MDRDFYFQQLVFIDGFYDHSDNAFSQPPVSGNGIMMWYPGAAYSDRQLQFSLFGSTLVYDSGSNTIAAVIASTDLTDATSAGRALLTSASASAQRSSLGLGTAATTASSAYATASQGSLAATAVQPGSLATVATTGAYADLTGKPAAVTRSFSNPSRTLNSAFQASSTRDAMVSYTVDVAATLTLTGGATGTVTLQYADDSGFTTSVVTVQSSVNGNSGALTIGLNLTQTGTCSLSGMIPAGKYAKLVTTNTAGSPTFTFRAAQEVLF